MENLEGPRATVTAYEGWAVVEILGRRVRAGYVREEEQYGTRMLRIDIPGPDGTKVTEWYAGGALFAVTPCDEGSAALLAADNQPEPVSPWMLERAQRKLEDLQRERAEAVAKQKADQARWARQGREEPDPYDEDSTKEDMPF